ncbi:hypothetical protein ACX0G9_19305 [Flavitalea flava]
MRYQYVVILKRDSDRVIDIISIILCAFSALNFLFEQVRSQHINYFLSLAFLILVTGIIINIRSAQINIRSARSGPYTISPDPDNAPSPRKTGSQVRYKYWLLTAGVAWLGMPYLQWLSIFFFVLTFLEYQAKYPLEIGLSDDRIVINTLFKQRFDWSAFNNIILKDGLLTLDFKTNRILQKEVLDDEEGDAEEDEFNDYCLQRLRLAAG